MDQNIIDRCKSVLAVNPNIGRRLLAKEVGIGDKLARNILKKIRPDGRKEEIVTPLSKDSYTFDESGNSANATSVSKNIKTLDELLAYSKVDLDVWEVERHVINKWEVVMREPATTVGGSGNKAVVCENDNGGKHTLWTRGNEKPMHETLYQVKAWLRRRVLILKTKYLIDDMLSAFRDQAPVLRFKPSKLKGVLLEVSIFDLHLGKLIWAPESGTNYDIKISQSAFNEALETLLQRVNGWPIERIVFPVGNDFFNVDGKEQETAAGTPQHEDVRWQKSFVLGRKLMLDAILRLRSIAPVDVLLIAGNHDTERVFYLGDALSGWLSKTDGVTVDNSPTFRKYYQFGKNMICYAHGKDEKMKDLPMIMASERPKMWGDTKYREAHIGHWHHKKEIHFQPVDEFTGTRVRIIPSLCPADAWHRMKGYEGLRSAEAFLWDSNGGNVGCFCFNP